MSETPRQVLSDEQIEDAIDRANRKFNAYASSGGARGQQVTPKDDWKHWLAREIEAAAIAALDAALAAVPQTELSPDYSEMSREALERHARRMAQMLADDKTRAFYHKHALGPLAAPSCLCCGQLPVKVAIQHMELPGVVVCEKCRNAALAAPAEPVASAGVKRIEAAARQAREALDQMLPSLESLRQSTPETASSIWDDKYADLVAHVERSIEALDAALAAPSDPAWLPTAENINALPEPLRRYVHDIETRCDPAGDVAQIAFLKDQVRQLEASNRQFRDALAAPAEPPVVLLAAGTLVHVNGMPFRLMEVARAEGNEANLREA